MVKITCDPPLNQKDYLDPPVWKPGEWWVVRYQGCEECVRLLSADNKVLTTDGRSPGACKTEYTLIRPVKEIIFKS